MGRALTIAIWTISIGTLLAAALVAMLFVQMAIGMDPTDIVANGAQPWSDALWASAAFAGLAIATVLGLRLWHTARFKPVGLVLTLLEAGFVVFACVKVYAEYF